MATDNFRGQFWMRQGYTFSVGTGADAGRVLCWCDGESWEASTADPKALLRAAEMHDRERSLATRRAVQALIRQ